MTHDEKRAWLALSHINISSNKLQQFLERYSSICELFELSEKQLVQLGFRAGLKERLDNVTDDIIEHDLSWFDSDNKHLIPFNSPDYPALLKEVESAPKLLFVQGNKELLNQYQIAIVGSRNPTPQGKENAANFAKTLAQAGAVITSGMALGVDGCAHQAALDQGLPTVAVAGTGLDRVYPASHKDMAQDIVEHGALVSEFALGKGVRASHFPARNRIIAGMSLGTLVVEAAIKSGSLITARLAMEQGREVFAIPGSIHNPLARGCHALIKQGVKLVETAEEIIEELQALALWQAQSWQTSNNLGGGETQKRSSNEFELDDDYQKLMQVIDYDTTSMDSIIDRSGLEIDVVSHMLLLLELNNHIVSVAGGYQRRSD
ncbi:DNA protecting protein DprA [Kangiella sediminilitoris]|uniref:DNA protecting protein DprA n=2 Tax=Kangiella sediminilitoris TaxID=1144748 RepID=A0A1B3BE09_9GAMM|nr:DNA protecting protein DprA [Kangiella sediminilitoris]